MVAYAKRESKQLPRLTPQEYLERERKAERKSEYYDGVIVAMSGASKEHNRITFNISGELYAQLKGKPCQAFVSDLRVRVPECNCYYYPDVVVVCGEPVFEDAELDTLLNPTLVIEVLSESTQAYDRGDKMECYQTLESLQAYVLVSQDKPLITIYRRQDKDWLYSPVKGLESVLTLDAIGCELRLADVYDRIQFPALQSEQPANGATAASE
ncbi:MAG TPA: Uma2 family endonuclease [Chthonomonadaceae bacterium]|nr:Uma2 family endonuclease [Chthonomonadaceae bacterium]